MAAAIGESAMPSTHRHPDRDPPPRIPPGGVLGPAGARPARTRWACGSRVPRRPSRAKSKAAGAATPRAKSVIIVFLTGGLSHLDSFDMKPDAPDGIRGEFRPIDTAVPGIQYLRAPAAAGRPGRQAGGRPVAVPTPTPTTSTRPTRS